MGAGLCPRSRYAFSVGREALELVRHVFLYSDNVPLEQELELKRQGAAAGLLVLRPDCGSTLLGGVGLGFANRVRRGPVGMVAASGTGLQAVSVRLDALGSGVSQALGTGGRDLSDSVGGTTTRQALELLARDPETRVIVLLSKPPGRRTAGRALRAAAATGKPVVVALLGHPAPARRLGSLHFASGLSDAAGLAARLAAEPARPAPDEQGREALVSSSAPTGPCLRGLMSGGTLAYVAVLALGPFLSPLRSNLVATAGELEGVEPLSDPGRSKGHTIVDLGADELTLGRPHPMIDQQLRDERRAELVVLLVGAEEDPQGLEAQTEALEAAGARLFRDPSRAWSHLLARGLGLARCGSLQPVPLGALEGPLAAINVGLELFHDSLREQGAKSLQVAWRPPAGGDERLVAMLERMRG